MPDLPTFNNGGVLPLIALLLVLFVIVVLIATRRRPKVAPPWVCRAGHVHTCQRGMDLCDAAEHEWPGVA